MTALTKNKSVLDWIEDKIALVKPDAVVWIDGSEEQLEALRAEACKTGEMIKLNEEKLPRLLFSIAPLSTMWPGWSIVLLSALTRKRMPAPPTIGWLPPMPIKCCMILPAAVIRAVPCM